MNLGVNCDGEMLSILLYTDDIVLLAESEQALQEMINKATDWCHNWRLKINVSKTNVVHFRKPTVGMTEFVFKFGNSEITKEDEYKYLDVIMHSSLNVDVATNLLSGSASRALGAVINKHKAIGGLGFSAFEALYDNLVVPILDYGSGVWGTGSYPKPQTIQNRAARSFLGVHRFASNVAIQGDIGWDSCRVRQKLNVIRLWCRLIAMNPSRLTKRIFLWDYYIDKHHILHNM